MAELRQSARFNDEALQAPLEGLVIFGRVGAHGTRPISGARSVAGRQVLLNGHRLVEIGVTGQVGDAEAPLAQHLDDLVPQQPRPGGERVTELF
ncbi:hypothetical protein MAIT1_02942 [Magnetofaba australis IT-1]|uniref:Uncharacterized protein n=1 Tax=Magnetofaba australis IT-1 TaxID=1434232 RepID=A0A1Y2K7T9_9PROT|nr:hypothetical protein MAIT1_02942 [Magnetofaba australis IT-1]